VYGIGLEGELNVSLAMHISIISAQRKTHFHLLNTVSNIEL